MLKKSSHWNSTKLTVIALCWQTLTTGDREAALEIARQAWIKAIFYWDTVFEQTRALLNVSAVLIAVVFGWLLFGRYSTMISNTIDTLRSRYELRNISESLLTTEKVRRCLWIEPRTHWVPGATAVPKPSHRTHAQCPQQQNNWEEQDGYQQSAHLQLCWEYNISRTMIASFRQFAPWNAARHCMCVTFSQRPNTLCLLVCWLRSA